MANLTPDQELVFSEFKDGTNIYLTGKAGTGKSFLTKHIINWCKGAKKSVVACAPTGIAALNIEGSTIHKTFRAPTEILEPESYCKNEDALKILRSAEVIVIDEISMCRIDLFEYIINTLQHLSAKKTPQLLVVGDFYQLPPVLTDTDKEAFSQLYGNRLFAFESELWRIFKVVTMELTTVMRQTDSEYIAALDNIRSGIADFKAFTVSNDPDPNAITLCGDNKEAEAINDRQLKALKKDIVNCEAEITGTVKSNEYPTLRTLSLCEGARVVMINNDKEKRWVNGTFATIAKVEPDELKIIIDGTDKPVFIDKHKWEFLEYSVKTDPDTGKKKLITKIRGEFKQYPVKLSWAISIHKSQGMTYERVNVSAKNIFAPGQLYVALSRCKSLKSMKIFGKLTEDKVMVSEAVIRFMSTPNVENVSIVSNEVIINKLSSDYKEGYKDGYDDGTRDTEQTYRQRIQNDPGVTVVSDFTKRQRELAQIEDPMIRNPKGAGRKKKPYNEKIPSTAIRVLGSLAPLFKDFNNIVREKPEVENLIVELLTSDLEKAKML